ncbi:hypothetical protein JZO67_001269 [Enterococcus sp. 665A]|uniref:Uncharacterized protein n=1 Tax=Candidatus Enterococcus ferrettii TaxID=2815324 RepID=A0ABV0ENM8_9ENTE
MNEVLENFKKCFYEIVAVFLQLKDAINFSAYIEIKLIK